MDRQWSGTTLAYFVDDDTYMRASVYMTDDPSDTVELRLLGSCEPGEHDRAHEFHGDQRRFIVRPIADGSSEARTRRRTRMLEAARRTRKLETPERTRTNTQVGRPFVLTKAHRKDRPEPN